MKNLKMSKTIQIILLTLLVVVIGIIIVGISSNNKVMATLEKCPKCNKGVLIVTNRTETGHSWICNNENCSYKYGEEEHRFEYITAEGIEGELKHKCVKKCKECYYQKEATEYCTDLLKQFSDLGNGKHKAICSACETYYELKHINDKNGVCQLCGAQTKIYDDGPCPKCDKGTLIAYEADENGHSWKCNNKECNYKYEEEEHRYEYLEADGIVGEMKHKCVKKCIKCGYEQSGTEWCTDLLKQFSDLGNGKHKAICSECKTWYELEHINDKEGNCQLCGAHTHEYEETGYEKFDNKSHEIVKKCELCGEIDKQEKEIHEFGLYADDENGTHSRICKKCSYKETVSHEFGLYVDNGNGTHSRICKKCSYKETNSHNLENGKCTECKYEEKQEEDKEENKEINIKSNKYKLDDKYISNVQPETTVSKLKKNIETNATEVKIYKNNKLVSNNENVGTGMKIQLKLGNITKEFTMIVKGDADGDGKIKMSDMTLVNKHRLNKKKLEEVYVLAIDVVEDGKVDFKDLTKINKFRLNKITEF